MDRNSNAVIEELIGRALGIPRDRVSDALEFNSIVEWDSVGHVNLMLALEETLGKEIDEVTMVSLTTVQAIRQFADSEIRPG